ncbi:MAG: hypothetical protein E7188_02845 [Erysipelotrichaceae bacterium]|nr:hypothetical protein [Erysipelotrichaceae bacterium]
MTAGKEYGRNEKDLVYLLKCALNGIPADVQRVSGMDLDAVYEAAKNHMVSAAAAFALESAGIKNPQFSTAMASSIRKAIAYDYERKRIVEAFTAHSIRYMLLKGCVLQSYYPRYGMREMIDNDILVDASRMDDIQKIMQDLGYEPEQTGLWKSIDVSYTKKPFFHFEMHTSLFEQDINRSVYEYYEHVWDRLKADGCAYRFTDEDFYCYLCAHDSKHYRTTGITLRSAMDIYIFLRRKDKLDLPRIEEELQKTGILSYEQKMRRLAFSLFGGEEMTPESETLLGEILSSAEKTRTQNRIEKHVDEQGRLAYTLHRIFLPMESIRTHYPLFYEHKALLVFLPVYRLWRGATKRRSVLKEELSALFKRTRKK